ncbi:MAG: sarcosine oxidase subunit gamma [Pseudomonadota bacterium]
MSTPPRAALWQVAAWPDTFTKVEKALAKACGADTPMPGRAQPGKTDTLLIRVEPLKWWVMAPDGTECPLQPKAADGAWLDLSHDQAAVTLSGPDAAELLKRMVSLDLREAAFPNLSFATTHMHHMITRVLRQDNSGAPAYHVMVMRSYADDLRELAEHHIHRFG